MIRAGLWTEGGETARSIRVALPTFRLLSFYSNFVCLPPFSCFCYQKRDYGTNSVIVTLAAAVTVVAAAVPSGENPRENPLLIINSKLHQKWGLPLSPDKMYGQHGDEMEKRAGLQAALSGESPVTMRMKALQLLLKKSVGSV